MYQAKLAKKGMMVISPIRAARQAKALSMINDAGSQIYNGSVDQFVRSVQLQAGFIHDTKTYMTWMKMDIDGKFTLTESGIQLLETFLDRNTKLKPPYSRIKFPAAFTKEGEKYFDSWAPLAVRDGFQNKDISQFLGYCILYGTMNSDEELEFKEQRDMFKISARAIYFRETIGPLYFTDIFKEPKRYLSSLLDDRFANKDVRAERLRVLDIDMAGDIAIEESKISDFTSEIGTSAISTSTMNEFYKDLEAVGTWADEIPQKRKQYLMMSSDQKIDLWKQHGQQWELQTGDSKSEVKYKVTQKMLMMDSMGYQGFDYCSENVLGGVVSYIRSKKLQNIMTGGGNDNVKFSKLVDEGLSMTMNNVCTMNKKELVIPVTMGEYEFLVQKDEGFIAFTKDSNPGSVVYSQLLLGDDKNGMQRYGQFNIQDFLLTSLDIQNSVTWYATHGYRLVGIKIGKIKAKFNPISSGGLNTTVGALIGPIVGVHVDPAGTGTLKTGWIMGTAPSQTRTAFFQGSIGLDCIKNPNTSMHLFATNGTAICTVNVSLYFKSIFSDSTQKVLNQFPYAERSDMVGRIAVNRVKGAQMLDNYISKFSVTDFKLLPIVKCRWRAHEFEWAASAAIARDPADSATTKIKKYLYRITKQLTILYVPDTHNKHYDRDQNCKNIFHMTVDFIFSMFQFIKENQRREPGYTATMFLGQMSDVMKPLVDKIGQLRTDYLKDYDEDDGYEGLIDSSMYKEVFASNAVWPKLSQFVSSPLYNTFINLVSLYAEGSNYVSFQNNWPYTDMAEETNWGKILRTKIISDQAQIKGLISEKQQSLLGPRFGGGENRFARQQFIKPKPGELI